jgi:hypothetical protein
VGDSAEGNVRPRLTIEIVVDGPRGPAWVEAAIREALDSDDVAISGVAIDDARDDGRAAGSGEPGPLGKALLRSYGRLDTKVFGADDDPTTTVDFRPVLEAARERAVAGSSSGTRPGPDVVLDLRAGPSRTPLDAARRTRFGTWSLAHGDDLPDELRPERLGLVPGGPEMLIGQPWTATRLLATTENGTSPIGQVVSSVDRLSMTRGARGHLRKLPRLVARCLAETRLSGALPRDPDEGWGTAADVRRDTAAGAGGGSLGAIAIGVALAGAGIGFFGRRVMRTLSPERWIVAISRTATAADPVAIVRNDHQVLHAPEGHEWADPFPVATDGRQFLFVEEYVKRPGKGRLAIVEPDDSARGWRSVETVLESDTHLSYPFMFSWEDAWYLMPEQASTGSLELYRATDFPRGWVWHSTQLPGISAGDATIAEIDGRWWLFAAVKVPGGNAADELHLFHAESPLGPWTGHAMNPVVSDVRTARPAGRMFQRDGRWYRPAQDGAISYGHSIAILEIERLDVDGYRQRLVEVIGPTWRPGLIATHTINAVDGLSAIDGLERVSRLRRRRPIR